MRFYSLGLLCAAVALAQTAPTSDGLSKAKQDIERMRELVAMGAVAPARLADAEQGFADAEDQEILNRTLYGKMTVEDLTEEQTAAMVSAATRRLERETARKDRLEKLVTSGVIARGELASVEQEIESRRLALDLAKSRASLLSELAEMARQEHAAESAPASAPQEWRASEHFEGDAPFTAKELKDVELAYEKRFRKSMPISANGETAVHRALGFDHRGRVDVAVTPDQEEGVWLREYLAKKDIPYFAFRTAIPGKATGAHIHIGPGSTRLRAAD